MSQVYCCWCLDSDVREISTINTYGEKLGDDKRGRGKESKCDFAKGA